MMSNDALRACVSQLPSYAIDRSVVVSEIIDDEAVIINLDTGNYYNLNETGSLLWGLLLTGSMDLQGLVLKFGERYVLPPNIDGILQSALEQWMAEGLVIRSEWVGGRPADREESQTAELREFTPPKLDIHTDMQDFLLVDPIHEVDDRGRTARRPDRPSSHLRTR